MSVVSMEVRWVWSQFSPYVHLYHDGQDQYLQQLPEYQAMGSAPNISADGYQDGGIRVGCWSAGWYPEPKAQWRDHLGQPLPATSEKISRDADGLFHTEISIVIMEESNRNVNCSVRNLLLNQEKTATVNISGKQGQKGYIS
ncbi:butyrophilin subfamily 2 member A1-like [Alligator mississippiensis]|uniref:butyrophilin subfamily 2 member A1-like n=1 Tax=Alligator mississippiensis TaxID=8496 RepID=UPI002877FAF2|nr:butyrophilin subfamily 2 member A1-like [Alligator mississippiensis]